MRIDIEMIGQSFHDLLDLHWLTGTHVVCAVNTAQQKHDETFRHVGCMQKISNRICINSEWLLRAAKYSDERRNESFTRLACAKRNENSAPRKAGSVLLAHRRH